MKYTKLIVSFLFLNLSLVFLMIFIANKTREIEKDNNILSLEIVKISENLKINKLELITHKNSSYLQKLYNLYFFQSNNNSLPNIVTINQILEEKNDFKLIKSNN